MNKVLQQRRLLSKLLVLRPSTLYMSHLWSFFWLCFNHLLIFGPWAPSLCISDDSAVFGQGDKDVESLMGRLKEQTTKQRHIIRQKERELSQRIVDLEAVSFSRP